MFGSIFVAGLLVLTSVPLVRRGAQPFAAGADRIRRCRRAQNVDGADVSDPTAQHCIISNGFASMGIAVPEAVAAKVAHPNRNIVAVTGDAGFMMNS